MTAKEGDIIGVDIVKETYPPVHQYQYTPGIKFRDLNNGATFKFGGALWKKLDKIHIQPVNEDGEEGMPQHIPPNFLIQEKDAEESRIIKPGEIVLGK